MRIHRMLFLISLFNILALYDASYSDPAATLDDVLIPKSTYIDAFNYRFAASIAGGDGNYDSVIQLSYNYIENMENDEFIVNLRKSHSDMETSYLLYAYAVMASAYDRKGYCFHAEDYYRKYMDILQTNYIVLGPYASDIYFPGEKTDAYRKKEDQFLSMAKESLPRFKKCLSKTDFLSMFDPTIERIIRQLDD